MGSRGRIGHYCSSGYVGEQRGLHVPKGWFSGPAMYMTTCAALLAQLDLETSPSTAQTTERIYGTMCLRNKMPWVHILNGS